MKKIIFKLTNFNRLAEYEIQSKEKNGENQLKSVSTLM